MSFTVDIENVAAAETGNGIHALTDPDANFAVEVYLSNVDASAGTLGLQFSPTTCSGLSQGLASDSSEIITITCDVDIAFTDASCLNIQYFCVEISEGADAVHVDSSTSNNIICEDITSQRTCLPGETYKFAFTSRKKRFLRYCEYMLIYFLSCISF